MREEDRLIRRTLLAVVPAFGLASAAEAATIRLPRRIVSLNPCLDEVLVQVADRTQIAALSHYARDPEGSTIAETARSFPQTFESAEEVMLLRPDLILASRHTSLATLNALGRLGMTLELFGVPDTVATSLAQVRRIAELVGRPDRGAAMVSQIQIAIAAAAPKAAAPKISALIFQPRGLAAGDGTLMDEMLTRTGFANAASRYGVRQWGSVSLERLIADPPQLLLSAEVEPGAPTWAERVISHPALEALAGRMQRAVFPARLLYCGGPTLIQSAAILSAARRQVESHA